MGARILGHTQREESARRSGVANSAASRGDRPRGLDPTTCDRMYKADEVEFGRAVDAYKRRTGRMFPTLSELLGILKGLGYARIAVARSAAEGMTPEASSSGDAEARA